jgi:hypothetical protein
MGNELGECPFCEESPVEVTETGSGHQESCALCFRMFCEDEDRAPKTLRSPMAWEQEETWA